MKTKYYILLAFAALLAFFYCSCSKSDKCRKYELPPATQSGENTFGCLVNGNVMIPRGVIYGPTPKIFSFNFETGELMMWINFYSYESDYECGIPSTVLKLIVDDINKTGVVDNTKVWCHTEIYYSQISARNYYYSSNLSALHANFEITKLDTTNRIISGIFELDCAYYVGDSYSYNHKAIVTEGRFDFKYIPDGSWVTGYSNND